VKNRRIIGILAVTVCLLVGITVASRRARQVTLYRGQSLKAWSIQAYHGNSNAMATLKDLGTNAIPELIHLLKTRDSFLRRQTWAQLPKFPRRLRRTIAQSYPPPQAEAVREAAAHALGRLGLEARAAIPALSRALRDPQGRVRWEAANALSSMGKESMTVLVEALNEKDSKVRQAAAHGLGQIGPEAVAAVPALAKGLEDPDQSVRNSAAYSLTVMGTPGFLALLDAVESGQVLSRGAAMRTLTNSGLPQMKACSEFLQMARDESPARRRRAIEALGAIRVAGSLAVHASLEASGGTEQGTARALTGCLKDDSAQIREAAARALQSLSVQRTN
jgi:HEAT repeat protein